MPSRDGRLGSDTLLLLASGTASALLSKLLYQEQAPGLDGHTKGFEKPWASTALMFLAMALCLPAAAAGRRLQAWLQWLEAASGWPSDDMSVPLLRPSAGPLPSSTPQQSATPLSVTPDTSVATGLEAGVGAALQLAAGSSPGPTPKALLLILVPTLYDLVATWLMSVGLLSITASIYQMLRGSEIVFTALISMVWLHRHLNHWHLGGIALCVAGIAVVGSASLLEGEGPSEQSAPSSSAHTTLLGMLLVVAAEAVQAAQVVTEEYFLNSSLNLAPLIVVGCEGMYGSLIMACMVLPLVQVLPGKEGGGIHEDSWDSWHMLAHSWQLRVVVACSLAGMAVYNVAGMLVTGSLGAVSRTVLETIRTLLVWLLNMLLFYADPAEGVTLGEPWTRHSWLQALGFCILVAGTIVYGHGEEVQERRLRAKLRWARLRESVATLVTSHEAWHPMKPMRIAGPASIRTSFLERAAVNELLERLAERKALAAAPAAQGTAGPSSVQNHGAPSGGSRDRQPAAAYELEP